jgi:hypothetical protein
MGVDHKGENTKQPKHPVQSKIRFMEAHGAKKM